MDEGAPIVRSKRVSPWHVMAGIPHLKAVSRREWRTIALAAAGFVTLTVIFTRVAHFLLGVLPMNESGGGALLVLSVFVIFLITNLSLLIPVPITMPIIIAAATATNPLFVGLAAAVGGAIGELGGYVVGRLGHSVLVRENYMCHLYDRFCNSRLQSDVEKHGPLAIAVLAVQPVLPFDVAGLFAGSVKMDIRKLFAALLIGRTIKYVVLSLMAGVLGYVPFLR